MEKIFRSDTKIGTYKISTSDFSHLDQKTMDSTQQSQDSSQQPPPFTIFNRQLQEPKHETTDGRFPPSYEEAMGIAPSSTSSVYTSEGHFSSGFTYSGWVNPESTNQTSSSNLPGSIYTVDSNQPEPYVSATVVTTR